MTTQTQQVQIEIQQAKDAVLLSEKLQKLMSSRPFKEVIEKELFEAVPQRLGRAFASPDPRQREYAERMMVTIGSLQSWISAILTEGEQMKYALEEYEANAPELLTEE